MLEIAAWATLIVTVVIAVRLSRLSTQAAAVVKRVDSLVTAHYPAYSPETIEHAQQELQRRLKEVEARSQEYSDSQAARHADPRTEAKMWDELQACDHHLASARETLDFLVMANAGVRAGLKTLTQVREDFDQMWSQQHRRLMDHVLEMNIYELLVMQQGIKFSQLKDGHELLIRCPTCSAETETTVQHLRESSSCSACNSDLQVAPMFVVGPQPSGRSFNRVSVTRDAS